MAVVHMDGWDYIPASATEPEQRTILAADGWFGGTGAIIRATTGRFGFGTAMALRNYELNNAVTVIQALGYVRQQYVIGMAAIVYFGANMFYIVRDEAGNANRLTITFAQTGILSFTLQGITYRTRAGVIRVGAWFYLQVKRNSNSFQALINGEVVINVAGLPAPSDYDSHSFAFSSGGGGMDVDDLYIVDPTEGTENLDYLGNVRVLSQLPVANGDNIQFIPNGLAANWQNAADFRLNSANYNSSPTVGHYDLYALNTGVTARQIFAIQVRGCYSQDNGVQLYAANRIKTGGVLFDGTQRGVFQIPGYSTQSDYYDLNPDTGLPWTPADLNALQIGPLLADSD